MGEWFSPGGMWCVFVCVGGVVLPWGRVCVLCAAQSCLTLCDPMDCSPPGFSVYRIFQARILEWVAISFNPNSGIELASLESPALAGGFFTTGATWKVP